MNDIPPGASTPESLRKENDPPQKNARPTGTKISHEKLFVMVCFAQKFVHSSLREPCGQVEG
jgi:hypothetical protein